MHRGAHILQDQLRLFFLAAVANSHSATEDIKTYTLLEIVQLAF